MSATPIRLGVAGLGRAFTLMLPTLLADARIALIAATDVRPQARERAANRLRLRVHADVAALCADRDVDAVYVATPHQYHADHAITAARHGKHVLVEKPMALSLAECEAMIHAADAGGVALVVGHSHGFDAPVQRARALIDAGTIGAVGMINAQYYTDFLYRLRRPEELSTDDGGGVVWNQAAHQIDVVRLLAGSDVTGVRAQTGRWDPARATEGAYAALLTFASGAFASLVYSGYAHFDGDSLCGGISEQGLPKVGADHGRARRQLEQTRGQVEAEVKGARNDAAFDSVVAAASPVRPAAQRWHEHFGMVVVSGLKGDLRLTPRGVVVYADDATWLDETPAGPIARVEVIDEFAAAIAGRRGTPHDGRSAMATLEVCLAMLASSAAQREIAVSAQPRP